MTGTAAAHNRGQDFRHFNRGQHLADAAKKARLAVQSKWKPTVSGWEAMGQEGVRVWGHKPKSKQGVCPYMLQSEELLREKDAGDR